MPICRKEGRCSGKGTSPWPRTTCTYGAGHFSHRYSTSTWASRFIPGAHGSPEECFARYLKDISGKDKGPKLVGLAGRTLCHDERPGIRSAADVLAYAVWAAQGAGANWEVPRAVSWRWSQHNLCCAFRKLSSQRISEGVSFPFIADLANAESLLAFHTWRQEEGRRSLQTLGPSGRSERARFAARTSAGKQQGGAASKGSWPPLVSFGLFPEEHFDRALQRAEEALPTEVGTAVDEDLEFAADRTLKNQQEKGGLRQEALNVIQELAKRLVKVNEHLRSLQNDGVRKVTETRDLGLLAVLCILTLWPDVEFPSELVWGFRAVGFIPHVHIFGEQPAEFMQEGDILKGSRQSNENMKAELKYSEDDAFLREVTGKGRLKGIRRRTVLGGGSEGKIRRLQSDQSVLRAPGGWSAKAVRQRGQRGADSPDGGPQQDHALLGNPAGSSREDTKHSVQKEGAQGLDRGRCDWDRGLARRVPLHADPSGAIGSLRWS